jgi:hypothetical protein
MNVKGEKDCMAPKCFEMAHSYKKNCPSLIYDAPWKASVVPQGVPVPQFDKRYANV